MSLGMFILLGVLTGFALIGIVATLIEDFSTTLIFLILFILLGVASYGVYASVENNNTEAVENV